MLVEFEEWSSHTYEKGRQSNTVDNSLKESRVFAMGRALELLFDSKTAEKTNKKD